MTFTASNGIQIHPTGRGGVYISGAANAGRPDYAPNVEPDETAALREYFQQEPDIELPRRLGSVIEIAGPTGGKANWMLITRSGMTVWLSVTGNAKTNAEMQTWLRLGAMVHKVIA